MAATRGFSRTLAVSLRSMLLLTLLLGLIYPALILGLGQLVAPAQANGSMLLRNGQPVGSALIGQPFTDATGSPDPRYFSPRPSAAGDGYDAAASSGSNLGPENPVMLQEIAERRAAYEKLNGTPAPPDALTASGSGLDPDISVANARAQADRVAGARGLAPSAVLALLGRETTGRDLGFLGEPRVNVLKLNLALDGLDT